MTQQSAGPSGGINISVQQIIKEMHDRYSKIINQLVQENAELAAGLEAQGAELDEYRARVAAARASGHAAFPQRAMPPAWTNEPGDTFPPGAEGDPFAGLTPEQQDEGARRLLEAIRNEPDKAYTSADPDAEMAEEVMHDVDPDSRPFGPLD